MVTNQLSQNPKKSTRNAKGQFQAKKPKPQQVVNGLYGAVQVVTSQRLKRSYVPDAARVDFFLPDCNLRDLMIIGIKLGVTVDEVMRGLVDMHLASTDQLSGLKNFIPALQ